MSELITTPGALSPSANTLHQTLKGFLQDFTVAADGYDGSPADAAGLEALTAAYSDLVTDPTYDAPFADLEHDGTSDGLVHNLRTASARCAAVMEKYRALRLLSGQADSVGYFANVESCIDEEFGAMSPDRASRVLLVGSGAFPMTLLNVASRTGAAAAGVDIDPEAVDLGRRVVQVLGDDLDITLEARPATDLSFTRSATHIVFSSTVAAKYELLHELHDVTRDDVVVAMRFGDGLKSLFNYPMQDVDPDRWRLVQTIRRTGHVFDIALYVKQHHGPEDR